MGLGFDFVHSLWVNSGVGSQNIKSTTEALMAQGRFIAQFRRVLCVLVVKFRALSWPV